MRSLVRPQRSPARATLQRLDAAVLAVTVLLAGFVHPARLHAAAGEYEVKAGYLVNFGSFVHWPAAAFAGPRTPFSVCLLGEAPFGDAFRQFEQNRVSGRPLAVETIAAAAEAPGRCQVLFVAASEGPRVSQILRELRGSPVLSVSDLDGFSSAGGMIQLVIRDQRVRFRINRAAAEAAGLRIDARLLSLAEAVD